MDLAEPVERIALNEEMLALATKLGDRVAGLRAHVRLVFDHLDRGDVPAADRQIEACERAARDFRQPGWQWQARMFRAMRAEMEGRFAEAEELREEAIAIARPLHDSNAQSSYVVQRICSLNHQRRFEEALALRPEAALFFPEEILEMFFARPSIHLGRTEGLRDRVRKVASMFGYGAEIVVWLAYSWDLAAFDADRAREFYRQGLQSEHRNSYWGASGFVMLEPYPWFLALAAAHLDLWEEAETHFDNALRRAREMGMRPQVAGMQVDWARGLAARARPQDADRIRALRAEARETAVALGMRAMIAEIDGMEVA
jgi:tetratricopeptide (TPR) repeat protein